MCFFGIADQDFTDDRWVRSALLPDVERRDGLVELRFDMPEKLMLNKVAKPSGEILDDWRNDVKNWMDRKLSSIGRAFRSLGVEFSSENADLTRNFEGFWTLVEDAYQRAKTYADFNAFMMSRVVNEVWGYGTLFSRFSECQQILARAKRFGTFTIRARYYGICFLIILDIRTALYQKQNKQYNGYSKLGSHVYLVGIFDTKCGTLPKPINGAESTTSTLTLTILAIHGPIFFSMKSV